MLTGITMRNSSKIKLILSPGIIALLFVSCGKTPNYENSSLQNSLFPIEIIYFDSSSEETLGPFPIDRNYYARILDTIEPSGPKYVILKFFFDTETDSDEALSGQVKKYGNVLTQSTSFLEPLQKTSQEQLEEISITLDSKKLFKQDTMILPNPILFESFAGIGHVDFEIRNGEYQNCPLAMSVSGKVIPSLALRVGMMVSGSDPEWVDGSISLDGTPLSDRNGRFRLNLSEPENLYPTYSFIDVLEGNPADYNFQDRIVIIFIDNTSIRNISSEYDGKHNPAEIVADSINSVLLKLQ